MNDSTQAKMPGDAGLVRSKASLAKHTIFNYALAALIGMITSLQAFSQDIPLMMEMQDHKLRSISNGEVALQFTGGRYAGFLKTDSSIWYDELLQTLSTRGLYFSGTNDGILNIVTIGDMVEGAWPGHREKLDPFPAEHKLIDVEHMGGHTLEMGTLGNDVFIYYDGLHIQKILVSHQNSAIDMKAIRTRDGIRWTTWWQRDSALIFEVIRDRKGNLESIFFSGGGKDYENAIEVKFKQQRVWRVVQYFLPSATEDTPVVYYIYKRNGNLKSKTSAYIPATRLQQ